MKHKNARKSKYSEEFAHEKIQAVASDRALGLSLVQACKKHGITPGLHQRLRNLIKDGPKIIVHDNPAQGPRPRKVKSSAGKCMVIVADIGSLGSILKEFQ